MGSVRFIRVISLAAAAALAVAGAAFGSSGSGSGGGGGTTTTTSGGTASTSTLAFADEQLAVGNVGVKYASFITANGGLGTPYEFKLVAGRLPSGLTLAKFYGMQSTVISGTPQAVETTSFTVEVRDGTGHTARKAYTLTVNGATPVTLNDADTLNPGTVGVSYIHNLWVSGGAAPYSWAIVGGSLPPGLSLSAFGSITGTPTTAGTFSFTIRVSDKLGQQATRTFSIVVT